MEAHQSLTPRKTRQEPVAHFFGALRPGDQKPSSVTVPRQSDAPRFDLRRLRNRRGQEGRQQPVSLAPPERAIDGAPKPASASSPLRCSTTASIGAPLASAPALPLPKRRAIASPIESPAARAKADVASVPAAWQSARSAFADTSTRGSSPF